MKTLWLISLFLLFACTEKKMMAENVKPTETTKKEEMVIATKKVPSAVSGFTHHKSLNLFIKKSVVASAKKRILNDVKRGEIASNNKSRFKSLPVAIPDQQKYPFWTEYFGNRKIVGMVDVNLRIGKDGYPDTIHFVKALDNPNANMVLANYLSKFKFKPAIHARSKKPVRAWYRFRTTF